MKCQKEDCQLIRRVELLFLEIKQIKKNYKNFEIESHNKKRNSEKKLNENHHDKKNFMTKFFELNLKFSHNASKCKFLDILSYTLSMLYYIRATISLHCYVHMEVSIIKLVGYGILFNIMFHEK